MRDDFYNIQVLSKLDYTDPVLVLFCLGLTSGNTGFEE